MNFRNTTERWAAAVLVCFVALVGVIAYYIGYALGAL